ncbi:SGNH/GDSL hydrolase family protein [Rahnella aquatilis]|uniref:SGNH/GDSL hydrolase family protein n=1 Tax=Rahnella aquatilis TaxID=34038 RepID=UPI003646AD1C
MSDLDESPSWESNILQLEESDKAKAGPNGVLNVQANQLANRTQFLKVSLESIPDYREYTFYITPSDPDGTIAGLSATPNQQFFRVAQGMGSVTSFIYYLNNNGVAVSVAQQVGQAAMDGIKAQIKSVETKPKMVPIVVDDNDNVPIWLNNGDLDAYGLGPNIKSAITQQVTGLGISSAESKSKKVPLIVDEAGNVALWFENGDLGAKGITAKLLAIIAAALNIDIDGSLYQPREAPLSSNLPVATDGRTLFRLKARLNSMLSTSTKNTKVMTIGDSWSEYVAIPKGLYSVLTTDYGAANSSYISVNGTYLLNGVTFSKSGWALYDASVASLPPTAGRGCGIDGQSLSASGTAAVINIASQPCNRIVIFYQDLNGSFNYSVDGGPETMVTGTNTSTMKSVSILLADGLHSLNINTAGNTGTVVIHGFYCPRDDVKGIEIQKCGNAGITGEGVSAYSNFISQYVSTLSPDVVLVILGTNEILQQKTVESYTTGLTNLVSQLKAGNSDTGIIFISPARCYRTAAPDGPVDGTPYRNAMHKLAQNLGVEFYNFYDDWGSYDQMNTLGVWTDTAHLNDKGGYSLARTLNNRFFKI